MALLQPVERDLMQQRDGTKLNSKMSAQFTECVRCSSLVNALSQIGLFNSRHFDMSQREKHRV